MSDTTTTPTETDIIMNEAAYHAKVDEVCGGKADDQTHLYAERGRLTAIIARLNAQIEILKSKIAELDVPMLFNNLRDKGEKK